MLLFVLAIPLLHWSDGFAQSVDSTLWVTNGYVSALVADSGTVYIGGRFSQVGPPTGGGVAIDAGTGSVQLPLLRVAGEIYAVAPDGSGGWYLGGNFTSVRGQTRYHLAQVDATGKVTAWNPNPSWSVHALAVSGSTVYVGGDFGFIGGQPRSNIAALSAVTGLATAWNPNANNVVRALAISGSTIYAAGSFTNIGGQLRNRIAALNATTGLATTWSPFADQPVVSLAVSGSTVYAAGDFTNIGGQPRNYIAALDSSSGVATAWNPNASSAVYALTVSGSTIYAGGFFTSIGGQPRNRIAALSAASGTATSWNPNANNNVRTLAVNGTTVYAGGQFSSVGGQTRYRIAALDAGTGLATAWAPNADSTVRAIAVSGTRVYAGGEFASVGGQVRGNFAALDAATGAVRPWSANTNREVWALARKGNRIYVGGEFTTIGFVPTPYVAAVDAATGVVDPGWAPTPDGYVRAIATMGDTVYLGGDFMHVGGPPRVGLAAVNAAAPGAFTSWSPSANNVMSLAVKGSTVYVGGFFAGINTTPRDGIGAVDAISGAVTDWDPNANGGAYVRTLALSGNTLYVGGGFSSMGGQPRNNIAALDLMGGAATAWNPNASDVVTSLSVSGSRVYAAGAFTSIGGQFRDYAAALDAGTGAATAWSVLPGVTPGSYVTQVAVNGGRVYLGGTFRIMNDAPFHGIASFNAQMTADAVEPAVRGNSGDVRVNLTGSGIDPGASVRLTLAGEPDIPGTRVTVSPEGALLTATFTLTGVTPGAWSVVVTNPDLEEATLVDGFTVEALESPQLRVDLIGPSLMRASRLTAFDVVIQNLGNVDAIGVPVWLYGVPISGVVTANFALSPPPQAPGEPDWSTVPATFTSATSRYLPVVIPRIPPGVVSLRFSVSVPPGIPTFKPKVALTPPWEDRSDLEVCLTGTIVSPSCMSGVLEQIQDVQASSTEMTAMSGIGVWAKEAWSCEGAPTLPIALLEAEQVLDYMALAVETNTAGPVCVGPLRPRWRDSVVVNVVFAVDPNDKLGAQVVGGPESAVPYTIRFENLETSTGDAQQVTVVDALDLTKLNAASVRLEAITFGNRRIVPPPNVSSFTTDVDLRPQRNLVVRVHASVSVVTGVLTWTFTTIDPVTWEPPLIEGFLPPNDSPPEGEGSVLFTVHPLAGLADGSQIQNRATINFDGSPLLTPIWATLMDRSPPTSAVLPLSGQVDSTRFTVRWNGTGADLRDYTIYVSENGGTYRVWRQNTVATADTFASRPGGVQYRFYSIARDLRNNLEPAPLVADAATFSQTTAAEGPGAARLSLEGVHPNPAFGPMRVWFTLPGHERTTLDLIDVTGRRIARREVGDLGPGRHSIEMGSPTIRPGLYFLKLQQAGTRDLTARVVLLK